ncbi:MAG: M56 family metallopeptidase [Bacteroidota bacterium]
MTSWIVYLLESSALMAMLYSLYLVLMRRETFFELNRFFLLGILIVSLLVPFLSFQWMSTSSGVVQQQVEDLGDVRQAYYEALDQWTYESTSAIGDAAIQANDRSNEPKLNVLLIGVVSVYAMGVIILLSRLVWTCWWILTLGKSNQQFVIDGVKVVALQQKVAPFSFMRSMYAHKEMIGTDEFSKILLHEKTHIQQGHSVDLVLVQLLGAFWWFNPAIWFLVKSLKQTHEYIADEHMINRGYSLVEYQTLLLRQLISNNSLGLIHHFNLSFIKKRITMMKNTRSGWSGRIRVTIALATAIVFGALIVQCNSTFDQQLDPDTGAISDRTSPKVLLPVLESNGFTASYRKDDVLDLAVKADQIFVNGNEVPLDQFESQVTNAGISERGVVRVTIDRGQSMGLIRNLQTTLRQLNRRKILYVGSDESGAEVIMPFLLAPWPGTGGVELPVIDEAYLQEHNMEALKIKVGDDQGSKLRSTVYDFVNEQLGLKKNYVVSAKYEDENTYGQYLSGIYYVHDAFNQIYNERAEAMFGKSWAEIRNKDRADATAKKEYDAVRKGIPRAISVAEAD